MRILAKLDTKTHYTQGHVFLIRIDTLLWTSLFALSKLCFTNQLLVFPERCFDCIISPNCSLTKDFHVKKKKTTTTRVSAD